MGKKFCYGGKKIGEKNMEETLKKLWVKTL